jgi:hypothetical protein
MSAERISFICKFWILSNSEKSELTYFGHFEGPLLCRGGSCWIFFFFFFAALWGEDWRLSWSEEFMTVKQLLDDLQSFEKNMWRLPWIEEVEVVKLLLSDLQHLRRRSGGFLEARNWWL